MKKITLKLLLSAVAVLLLQTLISSDTSAGEIAQPIEWQQLPGDAVDIDISMQGEVWIVTKDGRIKTWQGTGWAERPGKALRIAAGPRGNTWIIDPQNRIFRWGGEAWVPMPGRASDIAVGASGRIWIIGTEKKAGNYSVYKWGTTNWISVPGAGTRISVGPKGNPWIVNAKHEIYRLTRGLWVRVPGTAREIALAANGVAWIIDPFESTDDGEQVRAWNGRRWVLYSGSLKGIATDARGFPWGFNARNEIFADPKSVVLKP